MTTVKAFLSLSVLLVRGDKLCVISGGRANSSIEDANDGWCNDLFVESFAWRPLKTLPDNSKFKYEKSEFNSFWRPLLDQSAAKPSDDKPVFTQAMGDIEYELSLHKANSELLASLTDFMVKNNIGKIGESCIDVAIRELSEKHNIDTRTPKQKAVDEAVLVIEMKRGSAGHAYKKYCGTLYDAGLLKC